MLTPARSFCPARPARWMLSAALLSALAGGAAGDDEDPCITGTCWDCFADTIVDCKEIFPEPNDEALRNTCAQAAGEAYLACNSTVDRDELNEIWIELLVRLQQCGQQFADPIAQKMCSDIAMEDFRRKLEELNNPNPDDQGCREDAVNVETGLTIHTFRDVIESEETNRMVPVYVTRSVGETISLASAGIGSTYDVSQMPCVRSVHLLATYQTKTGVVSNWLDHDMDPSDGAPLEAYLNPSSLVHADTVYLSALYMDAHGTPVMIESRLVLVADSPLSGDYNRDLSTDAYDLLDYIDGYTGTLRRADVNANGEVESADLNAFVSDLSSGS